MGLWQSTVGKKSVMAVTGLIMLAYLVTHVAANLLVFGPPELINRYASSLRMFGPLLWLARAVLLASVLLHIVAVVQLARRDWAARPVGYRMKVPQAATIASRSMRWGGVVIAVFIVLHVLHFTTGTLRPAPFEEGEVHANVVGSFRIGWVAALYVLAMVPVGLHLYHGAFGSVRSLGLGHASVHPLRRPVAIVVAGAIWIGFTVIPLGILLGLGRGG